LKTHLTLPTVKFRGGERNASKFFMPYLADILLKGAALRSRKLEVDGRKEKVFDIHRAA